jgi:hypothetical protein
VKYINDFGMSLINVEFVQSEYHKRGELLPYYYFYKNKYADNAVIIHDSVFVQNKIDFKNVDDNFKFLWHHGHLWNDQVNEKRLIRTLKYSDALLKLYEKKDEWYLCVGVMSFISHQYLTKIQDTFKIFNLLDHITTRNDRMCLERIFGLLCMALEPKFHPNKPSVFGIQYRWGYTYENYKQDKSHHTNLPDFTKVWSGR